VFFGTSALPDPGNSIPGKPGIPMSLPWIASAAGSGNGLSEENGVKSEEPNKIISG